MVIHIVDSDPRPIYQQIVDEVRRALLTGALGPDEPLPSVRQLAAELKVNPNTVQQAYRELEREGLAYGRRGQGTFAATLSNAATRRERESLARSVAERALVEAQRHGLSADDLIEAVRRAAESAAPARRARGGGA